MMKILPLSTEDSASEIGALATRKLRESPYFFLKNVSCHFDSGVLTLRGQVPQPQLKNFAEAIVWRIDGVDDVINRVEVVDPAYVPLGVRAVRNAG